MTPQIATLLLVKGIIIGSIYALISLGFNVIYKTTGILNFAQGEFLMIGSLASAWFHGMGGLPMGAAVILGVVVAGITGVLVDALAIRPARSAGSTVHIIITVGVAIILRCLAALTWGTEPYHLPPFMAGSVSLLGVPVEYQNLWILLVGFACMGGLALFFRLSSTGRAMRACAENPEAARLCGVNLNAMSAASFGLSAMLAGLGGVLLTPILSMSFDRGTMLGLKGFAAAILGGLGHPVAGVMGGIILGVLEQYSAWFSSAYKETLSLSLVVIILLLRPKGLLVK